MIAVTVNEALKFTQQPTGPGTARTS